MEVQVEHTVEVCRRHLNMCGLEFKGGKDLATRR